MYSNRVSSGAFALLASVSALASSAAFAGEDATPPADGNDILVTAERRETNLLRTPGSITPVSADDLAKRHIESLNDLASSVPGLGQTGGSPQTSLFIRGIGTSDPGAPQSVGFYIDDVYNPRAFGNNVFDLLDVKSVEVLRGPQGTLYGQNTSGGAVKVVSKKPSDKTEAVVLGEVGNYGAVRVSGYLAGPIIPGLLSASAAFTKRDRDGYVYNATLDYDVDNVRSDQARFKLQLTPASNIEATLAYTFLRDSSDTQSIIPLNFGNGDKRVTYTSRRITPARDVDTWSFHLGIDLSDALKLKSISAYRKLNNLNPVETTGRVGDTSGFIQLLKNRQKSEELQLTGDFGRLNFIVGAIYRHETFTMDRNAYQASAYSKILSDQGVTDKAIYGQATYEPFNGLRVTLGARYGWQDNNFSNSYYITNNAFAITRTVYAVSDLSYNDKDFSPKVGVDYQLLPNLLAYASWTRGSKSGGFNRAAANAQIASIAVTPEVVTAYEGGLKGKTSNNVLRGSIAVFYNDFKNYQSSITNPVIDGQLVVGAVVANAASATTYGVEVETTIQPVESLRLRGSAAYLSSKFDQFANPTGAASSNFTGNTLPYASKWIVNADITYDLPLAIPGKLSVNASGDYRTKAFSDVGNRDAVAIPKQFYANLGLTYVTANELWTFQALARNVFDKATIVGFRYDTPALGIRAAKFSAPRLATLSVKRSF